MKESIDNKKIVGADVFANNVFRDISDLTASKQI